MATRTHHTHSVAQGHLVRAGTLPTYTLQARGTGWVAAQPWQSPLGWLALQHRGSSTAWHSTARHGTVQQQQQSGCNSPILNAGTQPVGHMSWQDAQRPEALRSGCTPSMHVLAHAEQGWKVRSHMHCLVYDVGCCWGAPYHNHTQRCTVRFIYVYTGNRDYDKWGRMNGQDWDLPPATLMLCCRSTCGSHLPVVLAEQHSAVMHYPGVQ
jgi:hypothetical protein